MNLLQNAFEKIIDEKFSLESLRALYIARKLKQDGIEVNEEQLSSIKNQLNKKHIGNTIKLEIGSSTDNDITIELSDQKDLERFQAEINKSIEELYNKSIDNAAKTILASLKRDSARMIREHASLKKWFEKDVKKVWRQPLRLLEMIAVISVETGDKVNNDLREKAAQENDLVFEVLARLHARSCQIAYEILTLLKSGYADGAHARWRSLHEIVVVAYFIKDKGQVVAERYIDHQDVVVYKAALVYQKNCAKLGYKSYTEFELETLKIKKEAVINKYGVDFKNDYGWAVGFINNSKNSNPNFSQIEETADFEHLRPFYKLASHNVHAGPMRMHNSLGLRNIQDDRLLTGPSIRGLTTPIHSTAISLMQITIAFVNLLENIDSQVNGRILLTLCDNVCQAALKAEKVSES